MEKFSKEDIEITLKYLKMAPKNALNKEAAGIIEQLLKKTPNEMGYAAEIAESTASNFTKDNFYYIGYRQACLDLAKRYREIKNHF